MPVTWNSPFVGVCGAKETIKKNRTLVNQGSVYTNSDLPNGLFFGANERISHSRTPQDYLRIGRVILDFLAKIANICAQIILVIAVF
jgi:hypothetical protein